MKFEFDVNGEKKTAEVTFYTAQLYEAEFMSDIIADLFGSLNANDAEFSFEDGALVGIDFTKVSWTSVTKALWAAVKTADANTVPYPIWVRGMDGVNLWDVRDALIDAMSECFFRSETAEKKVDG